MCSRIGAMCSVAAVRGRAEVIRLLVREGNADADAMLNIVGLKASLLPLHLAAARGHNKAVEALIPHVSKLE